MTELLILSGEDLRRLMRFEDYIDAVAAAFALHADGKSFAPAPVQIPGSAEGTFHIKAASLPLGPGYVAIKVNANFPQNRVTGFPTIQGAVLLFNVTNGSPLALLDSAEITVQRTAAATALAARHLARPDSTVATVCGCGKQGGLQLLAVHHVLGLRRAFAWDIDPAIAQAFARQMSAELGIEVGTTANLRDATLASDVIVTCTTSRQAFLGFEDVQPGTFIAAVGADNPEKSEIRSDLMARAKVVTDVIAQCLEMGDTHHAIRHGAMAAADISCELGELITGRRAGRRASDEIIIFNSTGAGIQDVAAAARAFELAKNRRFGSWCALA